MTHYMEIVLIINNNKLTKPSKVSYYMVVPDTRTEINIRQDLFHQIV